MAGVSSHASTYVADFSTASEWDYASSTASGTRGLWNTVDRRIQSAISASATADTEMDFGDGSDGAFDNGPAQSGISIAGDTITINTDVKSTFNFSSFNLSGSLNPPVKTIRAIGTAPLKIRVLGSATIDGIIDLSGTTGTNNSVTGPTPGGARGAGGGVGGDGGYGTSLPGSASQSGTAPTGGVTTNIVMGGGAGANAGGGGNGGGGGCNGLGAAGVDASAGIGIGAGGAAGACTGAHTRVAVGTDFENLFVGGAGGGGGGGIAAVGGSQSTGGGGGGGGGALKLSVLGVLNFSGSITVKGGDGGANNLPAATLDCGGGGGGAAGGSVWIQSATLIQPLAPSPIGTVDVSGGAAGTSTNLNCAGVYDGGVGSIGVLRVDAPAASTAIVGTTVPFTPALQASKTYTVVSKPIELTYGYSALGTPVETIDKTTAGCSNTDALAVTYEGSNDGVSFEHAVDKTLISELDDYRYVRFKVTIGSTPSPCLTGLSIPIELRELSDLRLKGGLFCGSVSTAGRSNPKDAFGDLLLIALAGFSTLFLKKPRRLTQ